eukprot:CAMPEP_0196657966 /NCGR_PEP_ID=MMETSP1086-20130531/26429_1 /TAXON_ID=77921 /ORGANISM="Cyanoptyche  gloeocystis , Strain SAG4.97" /LENGTH=176 /DNA_ID=CAMNT_0041991295 /DNA_START=88 /DNA_END=618 /DNA_ORIENTATION=+
MSDNYPNYPNPPPAVQYQQSSYNSGGAQQTSSYPPAGYPQQPYQQQAAYPQQPYPQQTYQQQPYPTQPPAVGIPAAGYPPQYQQYPPQGYYVQPPPVLFTPGLAPVPVSLDQCELCGSMMDKSYRVNGCGWLFVIFMLFFFWPLICLPCCIRDSVMNDRVYTCRNCGNIHVVQTAM